MDNSIVGSIRDKVNIKKGNPLVKGCEKTGRNYNFAFASDAEEISLLIYNNNYDEILRVVLGQEYRTGNIFTCTISGVGLDKCYYCYEVAGEKIIDPYSKTVTGCEEFGIETDKSVHVSRIELDNFDWEDDRCPKIPYDNCIFYKINVRGFTKSRTSGVKKKGTFAGVIEKIPYLKELGITTLEIMPAYEFDEMRRFSQFRDSSVMGMYSSGMDSSQVNYWGYTSAFHFAPKASYSSVASNRTDYTVEFKKMVKKLHENGIEIVMEMYFDRESTDEILDCIRYWVINYHIDGVHLYGMETALNAAASDPVLADTKIITVYWNGDSQRKNTRSGIDGKKIVSRHFKNMGNYNEGFEKVARQFLKGDENKLAEFVEVCRSNPAQSANINYITNHNGFTLTDLVSFDRKHNEANGENNRDGEDFNYSWNCGVEGKSRKKKIMELRQRQIKNALLLVLLSQGTPLLLGGDEFCNSQGGNNNPYCVDCETSWLNWKGADAALETYNFTKKLIEFRMKHGILHMPVQLVANDQLSCGYPDVSYHGSSAWYNAMENYNRHIGIMYCSRYANDCIEENVDELIYIAYNMHWEEHELALPKASRECMWRLVLSSGAESDTIVENERVIKIKPRTIAVFVGTVLKNNRKTTKKSKKIMEEES